MGQTVHLRVCEAQMYVQANVCVYALRRDRAAERTRDRYKISKNGTGRFFGRVHAHPGAKKGAVFERAVAKSTGKAAIGSELVCSVQSEKDDGRL